MRHRPDSRLEGSKLPRLRRRRRKLGSRLPRLRAFASTTAIGPEAFATPAEDAKAVGGEIKKAGRQRRSLLPPRPRRFTYRQQHGAVLFGQVSRRKVVGDAGPKLGERASGVAKLRDSADSRGSRQRLSPRKTCRGFWKREFPFFRSPPT